MTTTPFISLAEAKAELNKKPNVTVDDGELPGFIVAACEIVEDVKGHVMPSACTAQLCALHTRSRSGAGGFRLGSFVGGPASGSLYRDRWFLDLPETPVLSVSALTSVATGLAVLPLPTPRDSLVDVPGPGEYVVGYVAGRAQVPANYRLAALELVWELWRATQVNGTGGRARTNNGETVIVPASAKSIPYPRVRMLLGIYGDTVSEHPVIA